nr:MAG TPA: tail tubular protein [Bacteriophage sp.]
MVSKIDICNLALAHLGQEPISSLTQEDERARRLNLFYEPVKAEVLRTHNWAFATVQEPLIRLEDPSAAPYPYLYQYPVEALFVRQITDSAYPGKKYPFREVFRRRLNQRAVETPAPQAVAEYTRHVKDETQLDPAFVKAFALALASDLALALTGDNALAKLLFNRYAASLDEARRSNMCEELSLPGRREESAFLEVR